VAKIIPYQTNRFQPIDYKRADDQIPPQPAGQLDLFNTQVDQGIQLPLAQNTFELALKLDLHNDPSAERYYLKSIENHESTAHSLCNLGVIAAHKQKMALAIDFFTRALLEEPRHIESHFNLANVYFIAGNIPLSVLHYQVVIQVTPDFKDVYFNLGLAYLEMEDFKSARINLQHYKSLNPDKNLQNLNLILESLASII